MFCDRCQRYYVNLLDHLLEHVELRMTAFSDVQSVIDAGAAELDAAADRVSAQMSSLNGTVDMTAWQSAVAKVVAIVPAPAAALEEPAEQAV